MSKSTLDLIFKTVGAITLILLSLTAQDIMEFNQLYILLMTGVVGFAIGL